MSTNFLFNITTRNQNNITIESYKQLIDLYTEHKNNLFETIEVQLFSWFDANLCAALGGILDKQITQLNTVQFVRMDTSIQKVLQRNGFLTYYGFLPQPDRFGTTIKYLKLKSTDGRFFNDYLMNEVLAHPKLPQMTVPLKRKIAASIYEMFVNAQTHSETEFIYTCGQFYPKDKQIEFTLVDTGIGYKQRVNRRFNRQLTSVQAIQWALVDGHSTKQDIPGGIGLALLKEFISKNKGKIQIVSDDGFYQLDVTGETTHTFKGAFPGTIINLQFKTDDPAAYALATEDLSDDLF
jgi:hypothetical protein